MEDQKTAIYSNKVSAGGKSYFFDIKETSKGGKYITVSESRKLPDGTWKRNSIIIFDSGADEFLKAVSETIEEMKK